ncbi:uncharacterized protein LAESUDRAFT_763652 [Laetiporus sulphureus 93-53]|uniref:Uncharacterized protein n=1 Tax=Laetiporus sulphureus 93-53 TaxID=1314785 RepID=A0A165BRL5_9APHY|nr:uncharacterized protein LAESUDRAFT_763652 [Laetiporus sulphureus 93-53]KZT01527.1 hypothetical protein LAESUDRAFT_763652 [Laetiporus sulphureus 93-53]
MQDTSQPSPVPRPGSLLDRLSNSSSPYLLNRLDSTAEQSFNASSQRSSPPLIQRISTQDLASTSDPECEDEQVYHPNTHANSVTQATPFTETSVHTQPTPVSPKTVDNFLASVLDPFVTKDRTPSESSAQPERADSPAVHSGLSNTPCDEAIMIEECRRLMLPQVIRNALQRHPDTDSAVLAHNARALFTDDWCKEMLEQARKVVSEMQRRGLNEGGFAQSAGIAQEEQTDVLACTKPAQGNQSGSHPGTDTEIVSTARTEERHPELTETASGVHMHDPSAIQHEDNPVPASNAPSNGAAFPMDKSSAVYPHTDAYQEPSCNSMPRQPSSASPTADTPMDVDIIQQERSSLDHMIEQRQPSPASPTADPPMDVDIIQQERSSLDHSIEQPNSSASIGQLTHSIDVPLFVSKTEDQSEGPLQRDTHHDMHIGDASPVNQVPGLWAVQVGSRIPQITDFTFELQEPVAAAVRRWTRRRSTYNENATHVSVHLLCLPTMAVQEANQRLDPAASPAEVVAMLWNIDTSWPAPGTLVIEVNPADGRTARTYLPADLGQNMGHLDITADLRPGTNMIRLIQLRDTSERVFVVHASIPDLAERRLYAELGVRTQEWSAYIARASARLPGAQRV